MTPFDYMFSQSKTLDGLSFDKHSPLGVDALPSHPWAGLQEGNSLAFEGRPDLTKFAFFRVHDEAIEIASPFGCHRLALGSVDQAKPVGMLCVGGGERIGSWTVGVGPMWRGLRGEEPSVWALKAKPLESGAIEPVHMGMWSRGIDSKPETWTIVLLPSPADRVYEKQGSACIETHTGLFVLPAGRDSDGVLARRVQWGLPVEDGVFVLKRRSAAG